MLTYLASVRIHVLILHSIEVLAKALALAILAVAAMTMGCCQHHALTIVLRSRSRSLVEVKDGLVRSMVALTLVAELSAGACRM